MTIIFKLERLKRVCFSVRGERLPTHINFLLYGIQSTFACFEKSSISHTRMTCQLGPGAFTPQNDRGGGVYCVAREFYVFLCWQGAFTPDFCPFS